MSENSPIGSSENDENGKVGVLLAGGLGRRMGGGDKPLKSLDGRPLLAHIVERASPQVDCLILNINGDSTRFGDFDLPVVQDVVEGHAGPLAGIHAAMLWARNNRPKARWLVSFATDAPFFPALMVERLLHKQRDSDAQVVCARSRDRDHPVFALWSLDLAEDLYEAMVSENLRKIDLWTSRYVTRSVEFDDEVEDIDPFFNINRPSDLIDAGKLIETFQRDNRER